MDLKDLTAPCGLDCFNCVAYLANNNEEIRRLVATKTGTPYDDAACAGCRKETGICRFLHMTEPCKVFKCVSSKGIETCADCSDFPCDNLHPYAEHASELPHNIKVFNLALIRKIGVEKWAKEKAKSVRDTYFGGKWNI